MISGGMEVNPGYLKTFPLKALDSHLRQCWLKKYSKRSYIQILFSRVSLFNLESIFVEN